MNDIQFASVAPGQVVDPGYTTANASFPSTQPSLLPEPLAIPDDDAIAGFLALEARTRTLNLGRAVQNIQNLRKEQRVEWEKQKAALFEAARAAEDSGFWGSVGKICGTIGKVAAVATSVAVAAGTGGAGLPFVLAIAGACLSTGAIAQGEFNVLEKLGVDASTSGWIEMSLAVAGVACTAGAAWAGGAESASRFQKIAETAGKVSSAAAGGATVTAGIATGKKYAADAEARDCYADAESARINESRLGQLLIRILDDLEESEKSYRQTVAAAKGAMEIEDNTLLISIRRN